MASSTIFSSQRRFQVGRSSLRNNIAYTDICDNYFILNLSLQKISMIEIQPNEAIERIIRRYWLTLAPEIGTSTFFFWMPVALIVAAKSPELTILSSYYNYIYVGVLLYYLLFLATLLYVWMDYYLDILLITSQRILIIEQKGLFNRQVTAVPLERVQDITVRKRGILQTFFDFGDIQIQTAGEENYSMKDVSHPNETKNYILQKTPQFQDQKNESQLSNSPE